MATRNRHRPALGIVELAVDPADVDEQLRHGSHLQSQHVHDRGPH